MTPRHSDYALWCIDKFYIDDVMFKIYTNGEQYYLYNSAGNYIIDGNSISLLKLYAARQVKSTWQTPATTVM